MFVDFVVNGQGHGELAEQLQSVRFDPGMMRPYRDHKGRACVTVNTGRHKSVRNSRTGKLEARPIYTKKLVAELIANGITVNGPTSLRKLEWVQMDNVVIRAARARLRAWADLMSVSSFGGFNAMSKIILEYETMSDPGEAYVDMDSMTEGRNDAPKFQLQGIPLPITHSDFWMSSRKLAVSRNGSTPIDTVMGEAAGRRVAEKIEKTLIGVEAGVTFGDGSAYANTPTVYGYMNFPHRITTTIPIPTGSNASAIINAIINMRELAYAENYFGPFMVYHSPDWDAYLDQDYILTGGNVATQTLRQRIENIDGIKGVRRLDYLPSASYPFTIIMVQMTAEVARAINGMDITTVQWESMGGMRLNFKVMAIQVPQLRADQNGNTGIVHATGV